MTKEELIRLKKLLESPSEKYLDILKGDNEEGYYYQGITMELIDILKQNDSKKVAKLIISNFELAIYHYSQLGKKFNKMIINPCICPFIKESDLKEHDEFSEVVSLKDNPTLLDDFVKLDLYQLFVMDDDKYISKLGDTEYIPNYNATEWFIVSLKELKQELFKNGVTLVGINKLENLLNNNYLGTITLDFENTKNKQLKLTNK